MIVKSKTSVLMLVYFCWLKLTLVTAVADKGLYLENNSRYLWIVYSCLFYYARDNRLQI